LYSHTYALQDFTRRLNKIHVRESDGLFVLLKAKDEKLAFSLVATVATLLLLGAMTLPSAVHTQSWVWV
jgi:hypothetical protein